MYIGHLGSVLQLSLFAPTVATLTVCGEVNGRALAKMPVTCIWQPITIAPTPCPTPKGWTTNLTSLHTRIQYTVQCSSSSPAIFGIAQKPKTKQISVYQIHRLCTLQRRQQIKETITMQLVNLSRLNYNNIIIESRHITNNCIVIIL